MPLWSWGSDVYGRLGHGTEDKHLARPKEVEFFSSRAETAEEAEAERQLQAVVTCGSAHNIVVDGEGRCYTWGKCHYGQLGHGEMDQNELSPRPVAALCGVQLRSVAAGDSHVLAVTDGGQLFSWGVGFYGCLGHGDEKSLSVPRLVEALGSTGEDTGACSLRMRVASAAGGAFHSLAVTTEGRVLVWGRNHRGQLGLPPKKVPDYSAGPGSGGATKTVRLNKKTPVELSAVSNRCLEAAACNDHSLLLLKDGTVLSFGANDHKQLGRPKAEDGQPVGECHINPSTFGGKEVARISAGWDHCAAITKQGKLFTWGGGSQGQLGLGPGHLRDTPEPSMVRVTSGVSFTRVSCGDGFTVALAADDSVWTFGSGDYGKLGCGSASEHAPRKIDFKTAFKIDRVCCGTNHTLLYAK